MTAATAALDAANAVSGIPLAATMGGILIGCLMLLAWITRELNKSVDNTHDKDGSDQR